MRIVVRKSDYWPMSLSANQSGAKLTIHDISFGVTEEQVTFDPARYPNAKIVDKR